jgi:hypothetical protein
MICKGKLYFVRADTITKFFKAVVDTGALAGQNMNQTVTDPEGNRVNGVFFKQKSDMPVGLEYYECEIYSKSEVCLRDLFLTPEDALHEDHGPLTFNWARTDQLDERPVRIANFKGARDWTSFHAGVVKADQEMKDAETERLRQLNAADMGRSAESVIVTSGSRLKRGPSSMSVIGGEGDMVTPQKSKGNRGKGIGGGSPGIGLAGPPQAKRPRMEAGVGGSGLSSRASLVSETAGGKNMTSSATVIGGAEPGEKNTPRGFALFRNVDLLGRVL